MIITFFFEVENMYLYECKQVYLYFSIFIIQNMS